MKIMNFRILFSLLLLPVFSFSQIYKFNRQLIIRYDDEHKKHMDTWITPIIIEIQKKNIILTRPPTEAGERIHSDTLKIKSIDKERRDKKDNFTKIKVEDGRILIIYDDQYMTMCTKETKDHKRTEYVFYNQKD